METIYFEKITELKKNLARLQKELKIEVQIKGKQASIEGNPINEYEAHLVLGAMAFGFSAKKALQLKDPEIIFRKLHIKDYTRRKNLKEVISRLVGTKGKTKKTLEEISSSSIIIKDTEIGVIAPAELIEETTTAIINLIRGSKQSNVYRYLEKINTKEHGIE